MIACPAMAMASSAKASRVQRVSAIWCAAISRVAEPGGHRGGDQQDGPQAERTDQQRHARRWRRRGSRRGPGAGAAPCAAGAAHDHGQIGGGHAALGEHGAPGGAGDAEAGAVDQDDVERRVGGEAADGDHQRGAGVLQAAQHAGGGQHDQHRRDAERADPQVGDGVRGGGGRRRRRGRTRAGAPGDGHGDHGGAEQQGAARCRRCPAGWRRGGRRRRPGGRRRRWWRRRGRRRR